MKANDRFEKIISEMDLKSLKKMRLGLHIFTKLCIDNKFKKQRNAVIDFAIIANNVYSHRILKEYTNDNLPY